MSPDPTGPLNTGHEMYRHSEQTTHINDRSVYFIFTMNDKISRLFNITKIDLSFKKLIEALLKHQLKWGRYRSGAGETGYYV